MIGIIIAAGLGSRMKQFTINNPKCLLKIGKKSLLEWSFENLTNAGCKEVYVITGYKHEKIKELGYKTIFNKDFKKNNILHSFFCAKHLFDNEIMVSYADIYVEPQIYIELSKIKKDIVLTIDKEWEEYYQDRSGVPTSQAEKVELYNDLIIDVGKNVKMKKDKKYYEFIGLFKLSQKGSERIKNLFEEINHKYSKEENFIFNTSWYKAYITDYFHYIIKNKNCKIHPHIISKCWAEFDTYKDYLRLDNITKTQKLLSIN